MVVKDYIKVFNTQSSPLSADIINNINCDIMSIAIEGTFSTVAITISGTNTFDSTTFHAISSIKLDDYSICQNITATGLYEIPIEGLAKIKFEITSISGGNVTVDARLVDSGV